MLIWHRLIQQMLSLQTLFIMFIDKDVLKIFTSSLSMTLFYKLLRWEYDYFEGNQMSAY